MNYLVTFFYLFALFDMNPKSWTKNFRGFLCKKLRRGKNKQMQIVYDICI